MNLVPCKFPEAERPEPRWKDHIPMLASFVESDEECCRVDGMGDTRKLPGEVANIRKAIVEGGFADRVRLRTAKGVAYLVKVAPQQVIYR